ncbi:MAG: ATP-grasp domain-containing protein [Myxococcota bacterium]
MSVILIGAENDPQIEDLRAALHERDVLVRTIDVDDWPGDSKLTLDLDNDGHRVVFNGEEVGDELDAIYIRNLGLDPRSSSFEDDLEEDPFGLLNKLEEYRGLVMSTLEVLESREGVAVVNPTSSLSIQYAKPTQFKTFTDHDIPVPETVTTNDPQAVRTFVDEHGAAVFKPVSGGGYARLLNANELEEESLELLAESPVQFQQYVNGDSLRLYVLGGEVVAAGRILTEEIDYRTSEHDVEVIEPRDEIVDAAIKATWALGLTFAAVEVIDTGDEFVILEANPTPLFSVFDDLAGTDIADELAGFLASKPAERGPDVM